MGGTRDVAQRNNRSGRRKNRLRMAQHMLSEQESANTRNHDLKGLKKTVPHTNQPEATPVNGFPSKNTNLLTKTHALHSSRSLHPPNFPHLNAHCAPSVHPPFTRC